MDDSRLKALCEPSRYRILQMIQQKSYCVSALAHACGLSESSVSQHLRILREAGLVRGEKRGFYTHYSLDREELGKVIDELQRLVSFRPQPCSGPYFGCKEAEYVKCNVYLSQHKNDREDR
ncbi:MAG: winged helix-turn-helix transcriptional regulator [Clostridia bacterium]|nr:winged helix-turn-helix transcriptional regulator [Clostridia bacterium]